MKAIRYIGLFLIPTAALIACGGTPDGAEVKNLAEPTENVMGQSLASGALASEVDPESVFFTQTILSRMPDGSRAVATRPISLAEQLRKRDAREAQRAAHASGTPLKTVDTLTEGTCGGEYELEMWDQTGYVGNEICFEYTTEEQDYALLSSYHEDVACSSPVVYNNWFGYNWSSCYVHSYGQFNKVLSLYAGGDDGAFTKQDAWFVDTYTCLSWFTTDSFSDLSSIDRSCNYVIRGAVYL